MTSEKNKERSTLPASPAGGANDDVRNRFMEYNYAGYFNASLTKVDFNVPAAGSAPVKN